MRSPASELRARWLARAFESAGIDPTHWDPASGVEVNRRTIERVYAYYGRLYLWHARLEWAGMANLIGPSFYAGFQDVGFLPDETRRLLIRIGGAVGSGKRWLLRQNAVEGPVVGDLGFFETTFLTMQRKIFEDQALMHEAYLGAGLDAIGALREAGIIDEATAHAWEQIDSGDSDAVRAGNRTLLFREQYEIIDRFYVEMIGHRPPSGPLFTYALTVAGSPAIPGALTYPAVFPFTLSASLPRRIGVALRTPLPAGNLAVFANRWQLIERDTLPAYQHLITDESAELRELIERPIAERTRRFRLVRRAGALTWTLLTHWRLGVAATIASPVAPGEELEIDLTAPPSRDAVGMAEASHARVWANPKRPSFQITVMLAGGRAFRSEATLAVLQSPDQDANPTRLIVKLPATDLKGARATLDQLGSVWGLDKDAIALWADRAAATTTASHAYSTRVFRAAPIEVVRLEVQVEHHLEPDAYVLDALFSWDARLQARPTNSHRHEASELFQADSSSAA
jgi:hypothetical protein